MANPEHLEILKQGAEVYTLWRVDNPFERLDLSGAILREAKLKWADLSEASLNKADLSEASLNRADLRGADLRGALLIEADLMGANLIGANLMGADLNGANLREADLMGANLMRAYLMGADLRRVNLVGADLTEATVGGTTFDTNDLGTMKGLETLKHLGPSTIGIDTIYRSQGKIPEVFLRGCGVPETFITFAKSLVNSPIEFYSCFISYSSRNQDFAERLYADLQSKGVRCWYAPEDLKIGDKFRVRIDESIRTHEKLLLILSKDSVESRWVEKEVETAMERERQQGGETVVLFPIKLDDAILDEKSGWAADVRRTRHIGDFRGWKNHDEYRKAFDRLLRDLRAESKNQ